MVETKRHIECNGIVYPLVFNFNVMDKIQEKYGSYEKWGDLTDGKEHEVNLSALKFAVTEMINEGIDIENENTEVKREFVTTKQAGRIITELGIQKMTGKVQETVIASTKVEEEEKNV